MGIDSIYKNCYVTTVHDDWDPYGRMVCCYDTLEEAQQHIIYQKTKMKSKSHWGIMHIKDVEFLPAPEVD